LLSLLVAVAICTAKQKEVVVTANLDLDCNNSKLENYIESPGRLGFNRPVRRAAAGDNHRNRPDACWREPALRVRQCDVQDFVGGVRDGSVRR
jgi:hypothetical protein